MVAARRHPTVLSRMVTVLAVVVMLLITLILVYSTYKFRKGTHLPPGASCIIGGQCRSGKCDGGGIPNTPPAICL
jgi:hypothetical protein